MGMPTIVSINGLALNDSNFKTAFPNDSGFSWLNAMEKNVGIIELAKRPPILGDVQWKPKEFAVRVECLGTFVNQYDTLKTYLFDGDDAKPMILQDGAQLWTLQVVPNKNDFIMASEFTFSCVAPDPCALMAESDVTWNPTATLQTHNFTTAGNLRTRPVITITPTAAKGGWGYQEMVFSSIHNPNAWRMDYYAYDITNGGWNTAALIADATRSNQINQIGGVAAGATTIPIDTPVGVGLPARGMGMVGASAQISWTGNTGTSLTGVTWNVGGTTSSGTYADNTVIKYSHMMANGDDVAVFIDGVSVPVYFGGGGINSATTLIFINLNLSIKRELILKTAIGTGAISTIDFTLTAANKTALTAMPNKGQVRIDNELFCYTSKTINAKTYRLNGITRSQFGTNPTGVATHAVNTTVRWIEHAIWTCIGKLTAPTRSQNETRKPIINMTTSTNLSWVLNEFTDLTKLRSGSLTPNVAQGKGSSTYTGSHGDDADPASEAGMRGQTWQNNGQAQGETFQIIWAGTDGAGLTSLTPTWAAYRGYTDWPTLAAMQKSQNGVTWVTVWNQATPPSTAVWANYGPTASALGGTYRYFRFIFQGGIPGRQTVDNQVMFEVQALTLTKDSACVPQCMFGTLQSNYHLDMTLTNTLTGESISLEFAMETTYSLIIDCENKTVIYSKNNQRYDGALSNPVAAEWMTLRPLVNNPFQVDEDGLAGANIAVAANARRV